MHLSAVNFNGTIKWVEIVRSKIVMSTRFLAMAINVEWQTGHLCRLNPTRPGIIVEIEEIEERYLGRQKIPFSIRGREIRSTYSC